MEVATSVESTPQPTDDPSAYLAGDRRRAIAEGRVMPDRVTGAGLFADISGFTSLTEALTKELGTQRGADELVRHLSAVMREVIDDVDRHGGDVIYFSGDAITCWFDGDDGSRALGAAMAIQETMAGRGPVRTPGGIAVTLAIKVAVAVGEARRFVAGDPNMQLIDVLAGRLIDDLADAEQLAKPGDVLLAASAVRALGNRVRLSELRTHEGAPPEQAIGVVAAFDQVTALTDAPEVPELPEDLVRPWSLPAVYERLRSGHGEFLTEIRSAFPVFVRFGGIDYDLEDDAPEKLDAFIRHAQAIFVRHGGNLLQLTIGDKGAYLYAVFGSPVAHGDDAARAAAAALELREAASTHVEEPIQIGITHGRLLSGSYGHERRRTFACLGDAVNLSARLMSKAPAGQIYASAAVRIAASGRFEWTEVGLFPVKGRVEPVSVWQLEAGVSHVRRRAIRFPLPIVGRERELEVLAGSVAELPTTGGQVVSVSGDAGHGKSRLVAEAVRRMRAAEVPVAFGEAALMAGSASYDIWREVWQTLLGIDPEASPDDQVATALRAVNELDARMAQRAPLLSAVLGLDIADTPLTATFDAKLRKTSLEDLLARLLRAMAASAPQVVVLEDADRMDALSRDLFTALARAAAGSAVLLVATSRTSEQFDAVLAELPRVTRIDLSELDQASAATAARTKFEQLFGDTATISDAVVSLVVERSQGNPLYLEELLGFVHDQGLDTTDAAALARADLPGSLHALVLSRIDALSEGPRRTLKVASVVGRQFDSSLVGKVMPDAGGVHIEENLRVGREADLVTPDQEGMLSWLFRHGLTQEVAYLSLPYSLRTALHGRIAEELERGTAQDIETHLDLLAHHWWNSERDDKKVEYLRRAGEAAQRRYANTAAVDYFERLASLTSGATRMGALRRLGEVLELLGEWDRARDAQTEALDLAIDSDDPSTAAWCDVALAELDRKQGQYAEASARLDHAANVFAELGEAAGIGRVLHLNGTLAAQQGAFARARELYLESYELRRSLNDRAQMAAVLSNLGVVAEYEGDLDGAGRYHLEALAIRESLGDRWAIAVSHTNFGMVALLQGRAAEARDSFDRSMQLNREVGDSWMVAISHNNLANALRDLGETEGARASYLEALTSYARQRDLWALAFWFEDAAVLAAELDQLDTAWEFVGAADRCRTDIGSPRSEQAEGELIRRLTGGGSPSDQDQARRAQASRQVVEQSVNAALRFAG